MKRKLLNLQLLGEGGGASAGAASTGTDGGVAGASANGDLAESQGEDLSKVVYGRSSNENAADSQSGENQTTPNPEEKTKSFEDMIKKGGEFHDEFTKKSQDIIDKRFKQTKQLEDQIKSYGSLVDLLSMKYGVTDGNIEKLTEAIEADDSFFEDEAYKMGMPVEQYKKMLSMERENKALKEAREAQESQARQDSIYAKWESDAQAMCQKYGIENFDLAQEAQNPDFTRLLGNGIDLETAYMVIHRNDVMNNAMNVAARETKKAVVSNLQQRASRPKESGIESSGNAGIFKADPSKFTDADLDEIKRRVQRGEKIRF